MNDTPRALWPAVFLALLVLLGCAPGGGPGAAAGRDGAAVFRFRIPADPPSLDPIRSADLVSQTVVNNLFDPLVRLDPDSGRPVPALAERWSVSADGLTWRFVLRPGVRFHDGRPLTAGDVAYSFERLLDPAAGGVRPWILGPLSGAEAFRRGEATHVAGIATEGDSAVTLTLEAPYAPFLVQLSMSAASIVPRAVVDSLGPDRFGQQPVGTGPFRFVAWRHDSRIEVERFPQYACAAPPILERVEFVVAPNLSVALEAYRAGELDLLDQLPPGQVALVRRRMPEHLHLWPGLSVRYLGFNLSRAPFRDNRALRQAFNLAINREAIVRVLGEGVDVVSHGAVPPGLPGRDDASAGWPFDLERARTLLAEAGYPGGAGLTEITLLYNNDPVDRRMCEFVQACLAELGVRVRLKSLEWAAFLAAVRAGEAEMFRGSWIGDFPDAHNFLYTLFHSANWGDAGNYSRFADPQADSLLALAARSTDNELRERLYRQVEGIVLREAPWIFLFHPGQVALLQPRWQGGAFPMAGVWAFPLHRVHPAMAAGGGR